MAFTEEVRQAAFDRSRGQCECKRSGCSTHYMTRCQMRVSLHTASFHRKRDHMLHGTDELENCEVLCPMCSNQATLDAFGGGHT